MSFPKEVSERALLDCGRCCSICHKFCGTKMELHHIIQAADGGGDTYENCIPLCFDCHAEVKAYNPHHPKGKKYTDTELTEHRNRWYAKVEGTPFVIADVQVMKADRNVFNAIIEYLPIEMMELMRDIEFSGWKYKLGRFRSLEVLVDKCRIPQFQFMNADLEGAKGVLCESIRLYFSKSVGYIHSDDGEWCMIPRDWMVTNPSVFDKAVDELNAASMEVWNKYFDFYVAAKHKLGI